MTTFKTRTGYKRRLLPFLFNTNSCIQIVPRTRINWILSFDKHILTVRFRSCPPCLNIAEIFYIKCVLDVYLDDSVISYFALTRALLWNAKDSVWASSPSQRISEQAYLDSAGFGTSVGLYTWNNSILTIQKNTVQWPKECKNNHVYFHIKLIIPEVATFWVHY